MFWSSSSSWAVAACLVLHAEYAKGGRTGLLDRSRRRLAIFTSGGPKYSQGRIAIQALWSRRHLLNMHGWMVFGGSKMRANFVISICCAVLGVISLSAASTFAQQKTAKACTEEWRANKAANQAAGITEKDYVAKCKGGAATATAPKEAPTPNTKSATAKQVPTCQPSLSNLYHCPDTSPAASASPTGAERSRPNSVGASYFSVDRLGRHGKGSCFGVEIALGIQKLTA